jgi:hypothetical protein
VNAVRAFALFWYDFIVGDDWRVAAAVVLGLVGTALLARAGVPAWWLLPLAVVAFVWISVAAVGRKR